MPPSPNSSHLSDVVAAMLTTQRSSWEQGVAGQAILEYHQYRLDYPSQVVLPSLGVDTFLLLYGMAHEACLRGSTDGRLGTRVNSNDEGDGDGGALDPACIGQVVWFVEETIEKNDPDSNMLEDGLTGMALYLGQKAPKMVFRDDELPPTLLEQGHNHYALSHTTRRTQLWVDGVYMGPPFMTCLGLRGLAQDDVKWLLPLHTALDQIILYFHVLKLPSGLLAHIYDADIRGFPPPEQLFPGGYGKQAWGVGNGWAIGGIVRVFNTIHRFLYMHPDASTPLVIALTTIPETRLQNRLRMIGSLLVDTLETILKYLPVDGIFHNIIDDFTTFVETNLSQMVAATIFRLLQLYNHATHPISSPIISLLPDVSDEWKVALLQRAELMRNAAVAKVDRWGLVRGVCSSPRFDRPGTATEGQAWHVLMEVARAEYLMSRKE